MHSQPLLHLPPLLLDPLTISPSPPPPPQVPLHRRLRHHCSPPSVLVGFLPYDLSLQALEFIIGVWQRRRWDLWGAQVAGGGGVAMAVEGPHGAHQRVGPMEGPCGASWRQRTAQAARLPAVTPPPSGAHQAQPWYVSPYYYPWRSFFLRPPPHPPPHPNLIRGAMFLLLNGGNNVFLPELHLTAATPSRAPGHISKIYFFSYFLFKKL